MSATLSSSSVVWSVSELNRTVKTLLERELPLLWVSGEISNLTIAASGHLYFSLKDQGAQVRCVMFRGRAGLLPFRPQEGLRVEARATVTLYEARGDYQLNIEAMRLGGLGALFEAFERLKARLAAEGLFAAERKRPLPFLPRRVGLVTSPQAAALRDVLSTLKRRAPYLELVLYPTAVQGNGAAEQIAAAIATAGVRNEVEVLIVCRGGGSIEDLWAFNEEVVARAIAACPLPVISGVGHETDFTIADFVADQRAPTPTAAAEMVAPEARLLLARLAQSRMQLQSALRRRLEVRWQQLDFLARRLVHPGERLRRRAERMQLLGERLQNSLTRLLETRRWRLARLDDRLRHGRPDLSRQREHLVRVEARLTLALRLRLERERARLTRDTARLAALDPKAVLARGYSLIEGADGRLVRSATQLHLGDRLRLRLAEGEAGAVVAELAPDQGNLF
ncbi:exodeoxyribonuclease VII large subunit [Chitinimonas lacunae]|uniref:Exodeoxyribonuclease 7 large subunit n=1 Tax=Chitinimonas lacunae TaxID=1963018 RepID=A0ABV8MVS4_9NEIS